MIYSMTGFGRAEHSTDNKMFVVEIKSLNGKQFEIANRLTNQIKSNEVEIRNLLQQLLKRGTLEFSVTIKQDGAAKPMSINTELAKQYYNTTLELAKQLNINTENSAEQLLASVLRMPEVVAADIDTLSESDWEILKSLIVKAASQLNEFRKQEGVGLKNELAMRINNIVALLNDIQPFEAERLNKIKNRIENNLNEMVGKDKIDQNRMQQELIYFIEKIDISEEKQRLKVHCDYFLNILEEGREEGVGKKLGFVLQEIGREINTLGSKANDSDIQRIVVNMKDELEKAKEQSLNIL